MTKDGELIEADLMVWAAGVKAPDFFKEDRWSGETNRANQLVVKERCKPLLMTMSMLLVVCCLCYGRWQTCSAACSQSAHQMATQAMKNILVQINGGELKRINTWIMVHWYR